VFGAASPNLKLILGFSEEHGLALLVSARWAGIPIPVDGSSEDEKWASTRQGSSPLPAPQS